jgi:hypothetical protein
MIRGQQRLFMPDEKAALDDLRVAARGLDRLDRVGKLSPEARAIIRDYAVAYSRWVETVQRAA